MPLAVSATTVSGRSTDVSTNDRTWSPNSSRRSTLLDLARDLAARRDARRDHLLDLLQPGLLADGRRARRGTA